MQKLQISIPEPCHENWHAMTPTQQGRFCNACAKEVVDFSMMTDTEVLNYFTSITHEKVCGRALPIQLDRVISYPKEPKKRLFWYWNYFVMFFMFFSKTSTSKAQGNVQTVKVYDLNYPKQKEISLALEGRVGGLVITTTKFISGKITDENGNPVSFATILLKNSKVGIRADAEGKYRIRVNLKSDTLKISATGFESKTISLNGQSTYDFTLSQDSTLISGDVVIIRHYCTKRKKGVTTVLKAVKDSVVKKNPLKSVLSNVFNFAAKDSIKVYPNPVSPGNNINLSLKLSQTGVYQIQITDATGRIVLQKQTNITAKEYIEQVQTDTRWGSGVYYIRVFDNNNKPINKASFIVQ